MPAPFSAYLVFDVHRGGAELDQRFHGARDVECARPETGIDIDQQRQRADVGDAAHIGQHVVEIADAEIGQAQRAGGNTTTRQIDGFEADAFRHAGVIGVDGARDLQRFFGGDGGAKTCAGGREFRRA